MTALLVVLVVLGTFGMPGAAGSAAAATDAPGASTAALPALDRCKAGAAPDVKESVFHAGTKPSVSWPTTAPDPDNGIFPGDVVQVLVTGNLRYDTTHWTGPDGVGAPDALGIRPFSSTAIFNNLPGGWVGSERPTTSLAACTNAPAGYPVRLFYRLRDTNLADNAGGFTITTRIWRAPGRITIDRTEATQSVQNAFGQVALIGNKRTFVRVYLRHTDDGLGAMAGVTATMTVAGVAGTIAPTGAPSITTSVFGSDPRQLTNSFLFELPAAAITPGTRQAVVTVRPPTGRSGGFPIVRHVPLTFGPATQLTVIGLRYSYYNVPAVVKQALGQDQPGLNVANGWWQARQVADWEPLRRTAENALPLAHLWVVDDAPAGSPHSVWGTTWFDCKAVYDRGQWSCSGYADAKNWETAYIDAKCPNGGCTAMLLQPELDAGSNGTHWGSPKGNSINNMQGEADPRYQGFTFAHELGHSFGLAHTFEDPAYPRAEGALGNVVGFRYAPTISLVAGTDLALRPTAYDLMSYTKPAWFSPYSYCKAMANLAGPHPTCAAGLYG